MAKTDWTTWLERDDAWLDEFRPDPDSFGLEPQVLPVTWIEEHAVRLPVRTHRPRVRAGMSELAE